MKLFKLLQFSEAATIHSLHRNKLSSKKLFFTDRTLKYLEQLLQKIVKCFKLLACLQQQQSGSNYCSNGCVYCI